MRAPKGFLSDEFSAVDEPAIGPVSVPLSGARIAVDFGGSEAYKPGSLGKGGDDL